MRRLVFFAVASLLLAWPTVSAFAVDDAVSLRGLKEFHLTAGVRPGGGVVPGLTTERLEQQVTNQLREAEIQLSGPTLANLVVTVEVTRVGRLFYLYGVSVTVRQQALLNKDVVGKFHWLDSQSALALLWPASSVDAAKNDALASFGTPVVTWTRTQSGTTPATGEPRERILEAAEVMVRQFIDAYRGQL